MTITKCLFTDSEIDTASPRGDGATPMAGTSAYGATTPSGTPRDSREPRAQAVARAYVLVEMAPDDGVSTESSQGRGKMVILIVARHRLHQDRESLSEADDTGFFAFRMSHAHDDQIV